MEKCKGCKSVSLVNGFAHTLEGFNEYINSIASTWMFLSLIRGWEPLL